MKKREEQMCVNEHKEGAYAEGDTVMAKIFPAKHGMQFPRYDGPYTNVLSSNREDGAIH